jgi:hypothetical protein
MNAFQIVDRSVAEFNTKTELVLQQWSMLLANNTWTNEEYLLMFTETLTTIEKIAQTSYQNVYKLVDFMSDKQKVIKTVLAITLNNSKFDSATNAEIELIANDFFITHTSSSRMQTVRLRIEEFIYKRLQHFLPMHNPKEFAARMTEMVIQHAKPVDLTLVSKLPQAITKMFDETSSIVRDSSRGVKVYKNHPHAKYIDRILGFYNEMCALDVLVNPESFVH